VLAALLIAACAAGALAGCSSPDLERGTVRVGETSLAVWIADTAQEREAGLQAVPDISDSEGMFFVWDEPGVRSFAIKDVDYAVDLIFSSDQVYTW